MRRAWLVALVGCHGTVEWTSSPPARDSPTRPQVSALLVQAGAARELVPLRDVPTTTLGRQAMIEAMRAHVREVVPETEIAGEEAFLHALGALPPDVRYEDAVYELLTASLAGMYLPERHAIDLPGDLAPATFELSARHEAVHALQDQYFDLGARERYVPGRSDLTFAWACLGEGDATCASSADAPDEAQLEGSFVAREVAAPYIYGAAFVAALRREGGWARVNQAWRRPVLTTEQVLHPDKWRAEEPALAVEVPSARALGPDARVTWVDVRGELELRLLLGMAMPLAAASAGAEGWGGDVAIVVSRAPPSTEVGVAWRVRFDDDTSATRGLAAMSLAFSRACTVTRQARDVLVLAGVSPSVCARWSNEVLRSEVQ